MRALLTGHEGYLGTVMASILAAAGHELSARQKAGELDASMRPVG